MTKGYFSGNLFNKREEVTEILSVNCRRCGNTWKEEVTHYGTLLGYARSYDYCDRCEQVEES